MNNNINNKDLRNTQNGSYEDFRDSQRNRDLKNNQNDNKDLKNIQNTSDNNLGNIQNKVLRNDL